MKPSHIREADWKLLKAKYKDMDKVIKKLNQKYPVQYLIGNVNFYGYILNVNRHVLIPRFETETLLEKTMQYIQQYHFENSNVLDIGTGSGCIAIVLKKEIPTLKITAIDISSSALRVARKNAKKNKAEIHFIHKDMKKYKPMNKYSVIISNPPYIDLSEEIDPQTKYEPSIALYAKNNGLAYYEYILSHAYSLLEEKFLMAFEIGENQGEDLQKMALEYFPQASIRIEKDLAHKNRYLFIIHE